MVTQSVNERSPAADDSRGIRDGIVDHPVHAGDGCRDVGRRLTGDGEIIADIQHDLGNLFHKLYYWAECLRDAPRARSESATAGEQLECTIKQLQNFIKGALAYLAPIDLRRMSMSTDAVVDCFARNLATRLLGARVDVRRAASLPIVEILLDPGRVSQALEIAVRQVTSHVGDGSRVTLDVDSARVEAAHWIEFRIAIERPIDGARFLKTAEAGIEWALAEKLFALHGGTLFHEMAGSELCVVVIRLPVAGRADTISDATSERRG